MQTKNIREEEMKDIRSIIQLKFFEDVTEEDTRKTLWLLKMYADWVDIIKNYEFAMKERENGMSLYDLQSAEGNVAKRISGQELTSDVTANTVVLMDEREVYYKYYVTLTNIIKFAINNVRDPHQALIAKLLFIDGWSYGKAQKYLEGGYKKEVYPIQATTFAENRRKVIKKIANSLKLNRTLDFVVIRYGPGRNKDGELGLRIPNELAVSN